jgi:hypothetical protein
MNKSRLISKISYFKKNNRFYYKKEIEEIMICPYQSQIEISLMHLYQLKDKSRKIEKLKK